MKFRDCGSARLLFNITEWVFRILYARERCQIAHISHCSIQNGLRELNGKNSNRTKHEHGAKEKASYGRYMATDVRRKFFLTELILFFLYDINAESRLTTSNFCA